MVDRYLVDHWMGKSAEDITASWTAPYKNRWEEELRSRKAKFARKIVEAIARRAEEGDVAAVDWLIDRGWVRPDEDFVMMGDDGDAGD